MADMLTLYILLLVVFLTAVLATRASIAWAHHRNILDQPNHRSSHTRPTPRGGGIGIVAACMVGIAGAVVLGFLPIRVAAALACGLPIAVVGYIDDRRSLSARSRLLVQIASAAAALWLLSPLTTLTIFGLTLPVGLSIAVYLIGIVWMTNLYNFMDGIDGIAAGQAIAIGLCWAVVAGLTQAVAGIVFALAAAGFLVFNRPPAKVFMGDVGSAFCGFFIAVAALQMQQNTQENLILWLLPAAPFILDATVTLLVRMLRKQRPNEAHRSHAYQILSRKVGTHGPVSLCYFLIAIFWFGAFLWFGHNRENPIDPEILFSLAGLPFVIAGLVLGAGRSN
ncbi:MraY family glycosyltransferase [Achromobacter xylosoxidans]|uniref:MraY family glycosyltransferase n=1 Tax=Alcaligenes xylosoxydans xylosoxydans TaxID=85698 RepID=UPI0006C6F4E2|nr:glycosyltransferase family 4 protein [Achromobacter xylosoxidans]CUJ38203.1 Undecaprenyl-phosphate alpha-N-acetylglucosaminyl 1-phosphate transferase [Achromobacter xylosoxidans]